MALNSWLRKALRQLVVLHIVLLPAVITAQWIPQNSGTIEILNEIVFPSADTGYVAGANGTLLRTVDAGETWIPLDIGSTENLNDLFFLDSRQGYVVGNDRLFSMTDDAGEHWNTVNIAIDHLLELNAVCFTSKLTGYVGGRDDLNRSIILKTTDGGFTWDETNTPSSFLDINFKRIVFPTPDTGYALTRGMCMKTVDGGDHWFVTDTMLVESGGMFSLLEDAFFFTPDTGYIVGWYNGFSGYTVNGGETWTDQLISNNQWFSIDFPSRQTGYLTGWGQMMKTIDGGQNWMDISSAHIVDNSVYSIDFINDETGYACGTKGVILKTTNGGITQTHDIHFSSDLHIYPNPATGQIHLSIDLALPDDITRMSVSIYSVLGEKVMEVPDCDLSTIIDLHAIPKGVYLIMASLPENQYTTKLVLY